MIPDNLSLTTSTQDIEKQLLEEEDLDTLNDVISLFNISLKKKNLVRSSKLSEVQDKIVNQIAARVDDRPDNFSNEDLFQRTVC